MSAKNNVRWVASSQAIRIVTQLISITVLTHLLAPSDYGLMAIAAVFTNFAGLFRDFGTGSALIQRAELSDETSNAVFWLNSGLGIAIFLLLLAGAPVAASYYHEHQLQPVLSLLALTFPITCMTIVPGALFERSSQFKRLALIESATALISLALALVAAASGLGIYSLVLQSLSFTVLQSFLIFRASPWRPSRTPTIAGLKEILGFSAHVSGFQFINYFARNADSFIIGKVLGSAVLGVYSVAYRLMLFPVQNMSYVASRALYPLMSRECAEGRPLGPAYMRYLSAIAFLSAPLMAGMFVLREPLIAFVFGTKWSGVPAILAWLAPCGFIQSIMSTSGSALMASGNPRIMLKGGLVGSILQVSAFIIGVQFGIIGLVIAYFVSNVLTAIAVFTWLLPAVESNVTELWRALCYPIVGSMIATATAMGVNGLLGSWIDSWPLLRILIIGTVFCAIFFGLAVIFARRRIQVMLSLVPWKSGPSWARA